MTEDEAKAKACCGGPECGKANDSGIGREFRPRLCIASACMAWRQTSLTKETATHYADTPPPKGEGWIAVGPSWDGDPNRLLNREGGHTLQRFERHPEITGFCGLAGSPQ